MNLARIPASIGIHFHFLGIQMHVPGKVPGMMLILIQEPKCQRATFLLIYAKP